MNRELRLFTRRYASHAPLPPSHSHRRPPTMNRSSPARDGDTLGGLPLYPRNNSQSPSPLTRPSPSERAVPQRPSGATSRLELPDVTADRAQLARQSRLSCSTVAIAASPATPAHSRTHGRAPLADPLVLARPQSSATLSSPRPSATVRRPASSATTTAMRRPQTRRATPSPPSSRPSSSTFPRVRPQLLFRRRAAVSACSPRSCCHRAEPRPFLQAAATTCGPFFPRCAPPDPPRPRPRHLSPLPQPRHRHLPSSPSPASGACAPRAGSRRSAPRQRTRSATPSSRASSSRRRTSARRPTATLTVPSSRNGRPVEMGAANCRLQERAAAAAVREGDVRARTLGAEPRARRSTL